MLRNQRGMTRKALAHATPKSPSAISPSSRPALGNGSIVLLRRIARAIGLPVTQLVHEGSEPALDLVLLIAIPRAPVAAGACAKRATCCCAISASRRTTRAASASR